MASIKTKLTVGIFVLIGFGLALVAIVWFGMASQFEKGQYYAAYFDESVQGLNKDSPVKYRGVTIGRVASIGVAPDNRLIEVVLKIESGLKPGPGMVAELETVGITGIVYVELDRKEPGASDRAPQLDFESQYPVVATRPSDISKIIASVDNILNQIEAMDLAEIAGRTVRLLEDTRRSVNDLDLAAVSSDFRTALGRWNRVAAALESAGEGVTRLTDHSHRVVGRLDQVLADNADGLQQTISATHQAVARLDVLLDGPDEGQGLTGAVTDFRATMADTRRFMTRGERLLDDTDARLLGIERQLSMTLGHLERAGIHLERLLQSLADRPSRLVFPAPPPPLAPDPETE